MHNQMNGDGENVLQIFCRIRPSPDQQDMSLVHTSDTMVSVRRFGSVQEEQFVFEHVFGAESDQLQLFDDVGRPLVEGVLCESRDALLFSYGMTSSGKSHTINGDWQRPGLIPHLIDYIFGLLQRDNLLNRSINIVPDNRNHYCIQTKHTDDTPVQQLIAKARNVPRFEALSRLWQRRERPSLKPLPQSINGQRYTLFVSFVEIYNNYIYDLLSTNFEKGIESKRQTKAIRQDVNNGDAFVSGVNEVRVENAQEAIKMFLFGLKNRQTSSTLLNEHSSRSHSIFTLKVVSFDVEDGEFDDHDRSSDRLKVNLFTVVDLAGLERNGRTLNVGTKLAESGNINSSLFALRHCLDAMRKSQSLSRTLPIPYRQHKLTRLLQRFFERHSLIRMIICVKPNAGNFDENCQVLSFAKRAHEIIIEDIDDERDNNHTNEQSFLRLSLTRYQFDNAHIHALPQHKIIADIQRFVQRGPANIEKFMRTAEHICFKLNDSFAHSSQRTLSKSQPIEQTVWKAARKLSYVAEPEAALSTLLELQRELERAQANAFDAKRKAASILKTLEETIDPRLGAKATDDVFSRLAKWTPAQRKVNIANANTSREKVSRLRQIFEAKHREVSQQGKRARPTTRHETISKPGDGGKMNVNVLSKQIGCRLAFTPTIKAQRKQAQVQAPVINTNYRNVKPKVNSFRRTSSALRKLWLGEAKLAQSSKVPQLQSTYRRVSTVNHLPSRPPGSTCSVIHGPILLADRLRMRKSCQHTLDSATI